MASTTVYGLPYEAGTDEPGSSIRAEAGPLLAEAVETELARIDAAVQAIQDAQDVLEQAVTGTVSVTPSTSYTPVWGGTAYRGTQTVQLPPGLFGTTPRVTVTAHSSVPGTVIEVTVDNVTISSFDIVLARTTQTATTIAYHAAAAVLPTTPNTVEPGTGVAQLYRAAAQTLTTSTATDIIWDTATLDRLGGWSSTTNPTRWTPNIPGWYLVQGFVGYAAHATGTRRAALRKNGSSYVPGSFVQDAPASASFTFRVHTPMLLVQMNGTTDYLTVEAYQSSGGNLDTLATSDGNPNLTVVYAGPAS
jgi:hypothetical protein